MLSLKTLHFNVSEHTHCTRTSVISHFWPLISAKLLFRAAYRSKNTQGAAL